MKSMRRFIVVSAIAAGALVASAVPAFAWHSYVSGRAACDSATGQWQVTWRAENPNESWNSARYVMVIDHDSRGVFAPGTRVAMGQSASVTETISGTANGAQVNNLSVYWTDGRTNRDAKRVSASVVLRGTCNPPVRVPGVQYIVLGPNCDDVTFPVTISTEAGNTGTHVQLVVNNNPLFDQVMAPGSSRQVNVPITAGNTVVVAIRQDGRTLDTTSVTAPSQDVCHPQRPPVTTPPSAPKPPASSVTTPPIAAPAPVQPVQTLAFTGTGETIMLALIGFSIAGLGFFLQRKSRHDTVRGLIEG